MSITTHVLDTSLGKPAAGISVTLSVRIGNELQVLGHAVTDPNGRVLRFEHEPPLTLGSFCLSFETAGYFLATQRYCFFNRVTLDFQITDNEQHYHVPLLISPFGYTTYRGS